MTSNTSVYLHTLSVPFASAIYSLGLLSHNRLPYLFRGYLPGKGAN